jgi:hypothetical protein
MNRSSLLLALFLSVAFSAAAQENKPGAKLFHVVSFKFKDNADPAQVKKVEEAFRALKGKIKEIQTIHWGTNNSPEKLNKGYTHCWVLTFNSEKDRDAYLVHADHKAFGAMLGPVLDQVFVIDFWDKQ